MAQQRMNPEHRIVRSEWSTLTRTWWKFLMAGPMLIVTVIVGSRVGLDAWFIGFFAVILGFLSVAVGLVLGLGHLVARRGSVAHV